MVLANGAVRLMIEAKRFKEPQLVDFLVVVGKVLGVLNSEKHVQVLDAHFQTEVINDVYMGIMPDFDQNAFFTGDPKHTSVIL